MHNNVEEILSEEFTDFLFNQKHVSIAWLFQYLPIGRGIYPGKHGHPPAAHLDVAAILENDPQ